MGVSITEGAKVERIATALEGIAAGLGRVTLTVTMVGTDDSAVYDESVIITDAATGMQLCSVPYNRNPVQIELARDKSYILTGTQVNLARTKFYSPDVHTGIAQSDTAITVTYQVLDEANSLMAIQTAIQANPGVEIFPIGTEVTIPWEIEAGTSYDTVLILTHYGYFVKEEDKETGALSWLGIFLHKYAPIPSIQFDAPEVAEATETYAASGLYYCGKSGTTYTWLSLNQGDAIPYSDYDVVYHTEIYDSTFNIIKNGYNRWSHSAYRQLLNSTAGVGEWWTAQHVGDVAPSQLSQYRGYLAGFRVEDLAAMQTIKIMTAKNTVSDDGTLEETWDKMWLPSIKEVYGVEQLAGEGDSWAEYWHTYIGMTVPTNDANNLRKVYAVENHSSAQHVRLRSAGRGNSLSVWYINTSGQVANTNASSANRSVPACAIG